VNETNLLFAGMPHTGKSTYLALLNLAITSAQRCSLRIGNFKDDREYINRLATNLFACEEMERTEVGQSRGLSLSVLDHDGNASLLAIPDLSGETWLELLSERTWRASLQQQVEASTGLCLFVHAVDFEFATTIAEADRAAIALGEDVPGDEDGDPEHHDEAARSGQVDIVDLLQIVSGQFAHDSRRVSLVISAFDTVTGGRSPRDWVQHAAPLLHQFLTTNAHGPLVAVFGLSAQGGRFDDLASAAELRKTAPLSRAYLLNADGQPTDLDAPIQWAMSDGDDK
jgi:hypothetical protein